MLLSPYIPLVTTPTVILSVKVYSAPDIEKRKYSVKVMNSEPMKQYFFAIQLRIKYLEIRPLYMH